MGAIDSPSVQRQVHGRAAGLPAGALDCRDTLRQTIAAGPEHLDLLRRLAFPSMMTGPMHYRCEVLGALTLFMGADQMLQAGPKPEIQ